ncbi:Protein yecM [Salmonella enterica subsp. enterica]|nr:Protein yecM [Salmonella enterica subsp. enterica]
MNCMIFPQIYRDSLWRSENFPLALVCRLAPLRPITFHCAVTRIRRRSVGVAVFEQCGELLSENIINGRPICLFKLHEPVCVEHWRFSVIELPWPGEKRYPHEGWEHIEIVLPGEPETLNARALALLSDEGLSQPGIVVKTSSPQGEHERLPNLRWP